MRILALPRYGPLGSSSRLRFYQYLPFLEAHGIEVTVSPFFEDEYVTRLYQNRRQSIGFLAASYFRRLRILLTANQYDLVWVEKEFFPFLPAFAPALIRVPYVVDYDDAAFHRYDMHSSLLIRSILGKKIASVMRKSAAVVAGNDYLQAYASRAGADRIELLPTVIDTARYQPARRDDADEFRICWIGAPVTVGYLEAVEPALREFMVQRRSTLRVIGASDPFGGRIPVTLVPWTEETEVAELQQCDVGIMPLPDEPFERGKCGYKLIQYMGCGLPVVASPVGVNTQIVEPGVNGFLADNAANWVQALSQLQDDPDLRYRFGTAGRNKIVETYSVQAAAPKLLSLIQSI